MNGPQIPLEDTQGYPDAPCSAVGRLAPCPFCESAGAKCDYTICDKASEDCTDRIWFINCRKCGADGPVDNRQRGAADKWNRRGAWQCEGCRKLSAMAHWECICPGREPGCIGTTIARAHEKLSHEEGKIKL